ncbi:Sas10 C-terminal domain-containing protein [Syncephalis fuscata]|nr:Sas10 C-terminal domain-containing protein [Syncephalis fuscata]
MARGKHRGGRGGKRGNDRSNKNDRLDGGGASIRAIRTMKDVELDSEDECIQLMLNEQESDFDSDDNGQDEVMRVDMSGSEEDDNDDNDDEDEDEEDADENAWGSRKSTFYNADDADEAENAKEEEEEALRLQRARAEAMDEEDFVDEFASSLATLSAKGARPILQQGTEDDRIIQNVSDDLDRIDITSTTNKAIWPVVPKNATPAEMTKLIKEHAPELLDLLPEFEEHFKAVIEDTLPIVLAARKRGIDADDSTVYAFLETKYHILMTYLSNIAFYLSIKASSAMSAQDHPVLDVLVKTRTTLEELEDIEEAGMGELVEEFDAMLAEMADEDDLSMEEEAKQKTKKDKKRNKKKKEQKQKELLQQQKQQAVIDQFLEEYGDDSDEDAMDVEVSDTQQDEEESAFIPIPSKKVNRKRKALGDDFGDLHVLADDDAEDKQLSKRKNLRQYAVRVEQIANKRSKQVTMGGDNDLPYKDKHAAYIIRQQRDDARRAAMQAMNDSDSDDGHDHKQVSKTNRMNTHEDDDDASALYQSAQARVAAKRDAKAQAKLERLSADPNWVDPELVGDPTGKRTINYQILKNKGLAPKRTKEQRNPRVKHRKKFDKAQKKLKSVKAVGSGSSGVYGGEMTGIKTGVSRSVRFN